MAKIPIIIHENINDELLVLSEEVDKRHAGVYYKWYVQTLLRFFSVELRNKSNINIVNCYLDALQNVVKELLLRLQNMDFFIFESEHIIHPNYPSNLKYDFEKVYQKLEHPDYMGLYDYHLGRIKEYLKNYVVIDNIHDYDQVYLLINSALYYMNSHK